MRPPGQGNALQGTPIDGSWLCRMDPWKALDVSWDAADTPMNVPTRVSPWEASSRPHEDPRPSPMGAPALHADAQLSVRASLWL